MKGKGGGRPTHFMCMSMDVIYVCTRRPRRGRAVQATFDPLGAEPEGLRDVGSENTSFFEAVKRPAGLAVHLSCVLFAARARGGGDGGKTRVH